MGMRFCNHDHDYRHCLSHDTALAAALQMKLNPSNIYLFTVDVRKPFGRLILLGLENKTFL